MVCVLVFWLFFVKVHVHIIHRLIIFFIAWSPVVLSREKDGFTVQLVSASIKAYVHPLGFNKVRKNLPHIIGRTTPIQRVTMGCFVKQDKLRKAMQAIKLRKSPSQPCMAAKPWHPSADRHAILRKPERENAPDRVQPDA